MVSEAAHKILNEKKQVTKHCILYITIKNVGHMIPKRYNKMLRLVISTLFTFSSIDISHIYYFQIKITNVYFKKLYTAEEKKEVKWLIMANFLKLNEFYY